MCCSGWPNMCCNIPFAGIDAAIQTVSNNCRMAKHVGWIVTNKEMNKLVKPKPKHNQGLLMTLCQKSGCSPDILKYILMSKEFSSDNCKCIPPDQSIRYSRAPSIPFTASEPFANSNKYEIYGYSADDWLASKLDILLTQTPKKDKGLSKALLNDLNELYKSVAEEKPFAIDNGFDEMNTTDLLEGNQDIIDYTTNVRVSVKDDISASKTFKKGFNTDNLKHNRSSVSGHKRKSKLTWRPYDLKKSSHGLKNRHYSLGFGQNQQPFNAKNKNIKDFYADSRNSWAPPSQGQRDKFGYPITHEAGQNNQKPFETRQGYALTKVETRDYSGQGQWGATRQSSIIPSVSELRSKSRNI